MECLICMEVKTEGKVICCEKEICIKCVFKNKNNTCPFCRNDLYVYKINGEEIDIVEVKESIYKINDSDSDSTETFYTNGEESEYEDSTHS